MGLLNGKIVMALLAALAAGFAVAIATRGGGPGDVVVAPTTIDPGPESLAFDDRDEDPDPVDAIGDDATWMPITTESAGAAQEAEASVESSTTAPDGQPTVPMTAAPSTASTTVGSPAEGSPTTSSPAAASPTSPPTSATPTTAAPATTVPATATPTTAAPVPSTAAPTTATPSTTQRPPTVGFAGVSVGDFTNGNANVSQNGQDGSFRTVCTVSHFNFDDAIVFPGQEAATHLHMYFGNTLADFSSTGASLASSGDASCQGGPLNRSAYWVPAVLDRNGDVRPAQYMLAYYKRAGDEDVVPYPNGLEMVVGNAMAMAPQPGREQPIGGGVDYAWSCGSPITVGKHDAGRLIPNCSPGEFLTLSLIFPRCGDGRLSSPDNKSHMAYPAFYGAPCPASHPIRHPQLTYNIHWNNNDTNTGGWYLSSDDHRPMGGNLMPGGTTTHADWIGAWHPEVLDIMTSGCFNADHDCKGGTISPSLRLDSPNVQGYSPSNIYNSGVAPTVIPFAAL